MTDSGDVDGDGDRADALYRMHEALGLLDRAGLGLAGCHLQLAIDVATEETAPGDGLRPDRLD